MVESSLVVPRPIPVVVIEHVSTVLGTFLFLSLSFLLNLGFLFYCFHPCVPAADNKGVSGQQSGTASWR